MTISISKCSNCDSLKELILKMKALMELLIPAEMTVSTYSKQSNWTRRIKTEPVNQNTPGNVVIDRGVSLSVAREAKKLLDSIDTNEKYFCRR